MALTVGCRSADHFDLAGRQEPDDRVLPSAGTVVESAQRPTGSETADLDVGAQTDTELFGLANVTTPLLFGPQTVVVRHRKRSVQVRAVMT